VDYETTEEIKADQLVYPVCDSEILYNRQALKLLIAKASDFPRGVSVSLSSKLAIPDGIMKELEQLHHTLADNGGCLKIAASVSVFEPSDTRIFEAGAAKLGVRLDNLSRAKASNIPVSVTLKPVLPWIPLESYYSIVEQALPVTRLFTTGGLYLSMQTDFGRLNIAKYRDQLVDRQPSWLPQTVEWKYLEDKKQMSGIRAFIESSGGAHFDSDEALVSHLLPSLPDLDVRQAVNGISR
jgi:DNA repair photolyase